MHVADEGHDDTQRQLLVVASHAWPVGQRRPVPHDAPDPQGFGIIVPQVTASGDGALAQVSEHAQAPATQLCAEEHAVPQPPQLPRSVAVLTHAPLHSVRPLGHTQRPPAHVVLEGQRLPQAPQLALSLAVSTHAPLHDVVPDGHTQRPPLHPVPEGQRVPQAPQLFESVEVLTQAVPHAVVPVGHAQRPETQA